MKEGERIGSSRAAARTRRQVPQLSSVTVTCNGTAKRRSTGALRNLEPFKNKLSLGDVFVTEGQSKKQKQER